jgi:hypothetical protein
MIRRGTLSDPRLTRSRLNGCIEDGAAEASRCRATGVAGQSGCPFGEDGDMAQPTLSTDRLVLVPLADEHLELEIELDSDPKVMCP